MIVSRPTYFDRLHTALRRSPVTALLGPRQVGKTTLAQIFSADLQTEVFDLESQPDLRRLQNPELVLGILGGIVVIDEIQRMPELFEVLRVLVDRPGRSAKFLILGSASPDIIKNVSETLAGRVEFIELAGFDLTEVGEVEWQKLWLRGGFPRSFLAKSEEDSLVWRENFIRTFLERDIPQLGIRIPAQAMRRFWTMLAHYHGQTWNAAALGRAMGLSAKTVQSYLDILSGTFVVRQLQPWYANINKRQVKSAKTYLRDSGLLHALLELEDIQALFSHPKVGASWEGFALEQVIQVVQPREVYFWATHGGAELDLFFIQKGRRLGVEAKFQEAPKITKSMRIALETLALDHLWVVYPGPNTYPVDENITVLSLGELDMLL